MTHIFRVQIDCVVIWSPDKRDTEIGRGCSGAGGWLVGSLYLDCVMLAWSSTAVDLDCPLQGMPREACYISYQGHQYILAQRYW